MSNKYFLFCLSYESRSIAYIEKKYTDLCEFQKYCFSNKAIKETGQYLENKAKLETLQFDLNNKDICISEPLITMDVFIEFVKLIDANSELIIDCTTFTHEHLLMLLKVIYELTKLANVQIIYTLAEEYDNATTNVNHWLSKGVKDIRTIVGFNGSYYPNKKTHFIGMLGFEDDRMIAAIEAIEPSKISIGIASEHNSANNDLAKVNLNTADKLTNRFDEIFYSMESEITRFEFSAINAEETNENLTKLLDFNNDYNCVIFPMNNKISTIGLFLYSLKNENLQICYVEPCEYNILSYSSHKYKTINFNLTLRK